MSIMVGCCEIAERCLFSDSARRPGNKLAALTAQAHSECVNGPNVNGANVNINNCFANKSGPTRRCINTGFSSSFIASPAQIMAFEAIPKDLRALRACLVCSMIKVSAEMQHIPTGQAAFFTCSSNFALSSHSISSKRTAVIIVRTFCG